MREWYQSKDLPLMGLSEAGMRIMERGDFVKYQNALWVLTGANKEHGVVFIARFGMAKPVAVSDVYLEWDD